MAKQYYITETQYRKLIEAKKSRQDTYRTICEEIDKKKKTLTEATQLNEGIIDTIKKYWRAGALTAGILASLLAAQKVDAQQLQQAGVPTEMVQQAQEQIKFNPSQMTNQQIEKRLVQIMKQNHLKGSLQQYHALNPQQKENILNGIKKQITSLDDINAVSIGDWQKEFNSSDNAIEFAQHHESMVTVETVDTVSTVPLMKSFAKNSAVLSNPEQLKAELDSLIEGYTEIDSIVIETSSSTTRNTGPSEGMTWLELSTQRANAVAQILIGQNIDLGGEGVNIVGKITPEMIHINAQGENGDGTSGPKSPYEVNPQYVQSYKERGIDPKFWQSAAKDAPYPEQELYKYNLHQKVNIKIYARVVKTETKDVPSYRYVFLNVKNLGGNIETGTQVKKQNYKKCPVKTDQHQAHPDSPNQSKHHVPNHH